MLYVALSLGFGGLAYLILRAEGRARVTGGSVMGQLDAVKSAIAEAKTEQAADIERVAQRIEALSISEAEKSEIIDSVRGFGTALDSLAGTVETIPDVPVEPVVTGEPEPEPTVS